MGRLWNHAERKLAYKVVEEIRGERQVRSKDDRAHQQQPTLMQAWASAMSDPTSSTSSRDVDDPDTARIRQQLLGLQEAWSDFGEQGRWAILELLVGSLSTDVRKEMLNMWQQCTGVALSTPPPALLELRINLRKRGFEEPGEERGPKEQDVTDVTQTKRRQAAAEPPPGEGPTRGAEETEEKPDVHDEMEEAWRQQYEEMKNEEEMMDLEAYEEQLAIEAQEEYDREQLERSDW